MAKNEIKLHLDDYVTRQEMVRMHNEFINKINEAVETNNYIIATWLCYAVFEQRIHRILEKIITQCPKERRSSNDRPTSISTKIGCLKKLIKYSYASLDGVDTQLLVDIEEWNRKRNTLTHSLVRLDTYHDINQNFEEVARSGQELVARLYSEAGKVRVLFMSMEKIPDFPADYTSNVMKDGKKIKIPGCKNKNQCICIRQET